MVRDVFTMLELLRYIGFKVKINYKKNSLSISKSNLKLNPIAPYKLVKTMRAGVLVLGPLYQSLKKQKFLYPEDALLAPDL